MKLRLDVSETHAVPLSTVDWVPSPAPGVERRMLVRDGEEQAVCTTVVRYAPDSRFPEHAHPGGEAFLVLEGTFSDERGDYPAGTWVQNPPGSRHAPFTEQGCTIFVKLRQLPDEADAVVVDGFAGDPLIRIVDRDPIRQALTATGVWPAGTARSLRNAELLVLDGAVTLDGEPVETPCWIRVPEHREAILTVPERARVWLQQGGIGWNRPEDR